MENTKEFENTAHSYTEGAFYDDGHYRNGKTPPTGEHHPITVALEQLVKLHQREEFGDETITMKEWNAAITAGREALENLKTKS